MIGIPAPNRVVEINGIGVCTDEWHHWGTGASPLAVGTHKWHRLVQINNIIGIPAPDHVVQINCIRVLLAQMNCICGILALRSVVQIRLHYW